MKIKKCKINNSILTWLEVIIFERFGHHFELKEIDNYSINLSLSSQNGRIEIVSFSFFFSCCTSNLPCTVWDPDVENLQSILGSPIPMPGVETVRTPLIEQLDSGYVVNFDILGLTYWMLTRQEEIGCTELDNHRRFPAISSHAFKHNYLERPIVDEWLDILGQVIKKLWPGLKLKEHSFNIKVSHDVDNPSRYCFRKTWPVVRTIAEDILIRRDFFGAVKAPWIWMNCSKKLHSADPLNTFEWIMDISEKKGLRSAFYFICGRTNPSKDANYEVGDPAIRALIRRIHYRGHEIGLHPSYNSYKEPKFILDEFKKLRKICLEEGVNQDIWGGRMHYLRWENPLTMRAWEQANLDYDSTLGYADRPGFRCGTCHEYPAFDPTSEKMLNLRIRPLIVMECTIMAERYLGLTGEKALSKFIKLRDRCRAVNGCFTLLWHNSQFLTEEEEKLYQVILTS